MDVYEWLDYGFAKGYCSPAVCSTHDGLPMTDEENEEWDEGGDPCVHAVRLFQQYAATVPYGISITSQK
jgi:hypothetical protein